MIRSMTGFGTATFSDEDKTIQVEVKSLNSKFMDLSLRLPKAYAEMEGEWRTAVADRLERGKISVSADCFRTGKAELQQTYNKDIFLAYYRELSEMASGITTPSPDQLFQLALNSPGVVQSTAKDQVSPAEKELVMRLLAEAVNKCDEFRITEGAALESKLIDYLQSISDALREVSDLDKFRVDRVRARLLAGIQEVFGSDGYDTNRLEQEMIYYIEKLDIHEERVRLQTHLDYFLNVLGQPQSNGKKLGFIAQEIGREINTIGSKANDAAIQVHVIRMKEELEKIKEQLNNVL